MPSTIRGGDNFDSGQKLTLMTAKNSTSGTAIDFTGIPSWANRVTVMLNGVSTSGASVVQIQIGGVAIEVTGYSGFVAAGTASGYFINGHTTGFPLSGSTPATAANLLTGVVQLNRINASTWSALGSVASSSYQNASISGAKTLSGDLSRIRITTVNGADNFDAGTINVMYE
jgi:hypothetical protein